jgi:hypothetical protein
MSDLLQEIDEAIKRENAAKMWRENGPFLIGGLVLLVALTGAFAAWNAWELKKNTQQTNLLVSALETPYPQTALSAAAQALSGKHRAMAQLQAAGLEAQAGKNDEALKLYRLVAADSSAPGLWRDLATLMAVRLDWSATPTPEAAKTLSAELKPLLAKNNAWRLHALVQAATISAEGLQDYKGALSMLNDVISNAATAPSLRERAVALDHLYAMKIAATTPQKKTEKTPTAKDSVETEPKG